MIGWNVRAISADIPRIFLGRSADIPLARGVLRFLFSNLGVTGRDLGVLRFYRADCNQDCFKRRPRVCHSLHEFGDSHAAPRSNRRRGSIGCLSVRGRDGTDHDRPGVSAISFQPAAFNDVPGSDFRTYVPMR